MKLLIFLIVVIFFVAVTIYLTIKRKIKCTKCSSQNISRTGEKRYKEDPVAIWGSPSSYYEIEYKCNSCGNVFWEASDAAISN